MTPETQPHYNPSVRHTKSCIWVPFSICMNDLAGAALWLRIANAARFLSSSRIRIETLTGKRSDTQGGRGIGSWVTPHFASWCRRSGSQDAQAHISITVHQYSNGSTCGAATHSSTVTGTLLMWLVGQGIGWHGDDTTLRGSRNRRLIL